MAITVPPGAVAARQEGSWRQGYTIGAEQAERGEDLRSQLRQLAKENSRAVSVNHSTNGADSHRCESLVV